MLTVTAPIDLVPVALLKVTVPLTFVVETANAVLNELSIIVPAVMVRVPIVVVPVPVMVPPLVASFKIRVPKALIAPDDTS